MRQITRTTNRLDMGEPDGREVNSHCNHHSENEYHSRSVDFCNTIPFGSSKQITIVFFNKILGVPFLPTDERIFRSEKCERKAAKQKRSQNVLIKLINTFWCLGRRNLAYCCEVCLFFRWLSARLSLCVRCILQSCSWSILYCIGVGQYKCFAYSVNLTENSILSASQACFSSSRRSWCRWSFLFFCIHSFLAAYLWYFKTIFIFIVSFVVFFFSFLIYNSERKKNGQLLSMYWILFSFVTLIHLDNSRACKKDANFQQAIRIHFGHMENDTHSYRF